MTKERREALKILLGVMLSFALVLGVLMISVYGDSLEGLNITTGEDRELIVPSILDAGEIWTGKAAEHNPDGTITVTLYAWGSRFINESSSLQDPLGGDGCVTITDDLGEFRVKEVLSPVATPSSLAQVNNSMIWTVDQSNFLSLGTPLTVKYVLELKETGTPKLNYWYATGTAVAKFTPAKGNPVYWTKEESVSNAFTMSMNWNNGKGLNSGTITDNILGVTISFGKNSSPEFEYAYAWIPLPVPPPYPGYRIDSFCGDHGYTHWDTNAVVQGHPELNRWHLEWNKTNDAKNYYFTVGNLGKLQPQTGGAAIDIVYEVIFPNPGGNFSQPGRRTLKSDDFFHRSFEEGMEEKLFIWDGAEITVDLDVFGRIKLDDGLDHSGSLTVSKKLKGWYDFDWGVHEDTLFTAMVTDEDGNYLTFIPDALSGAPNRYTFTGVSNSVHIGSSLSFSVNNPATIEGVPEGMICTVEEILDRHSDLIAVSYDKGSVPIIMDTNSEVTVTNNYSHGLGKLEIWKLFDGFPSDWGVNNSTTFYVRIYDVDYHNYLWFKPEKEPDGTYRCIGNSVNKLSEPYVGTPMVEIPLKTGTPVALSNLWTWGRYEVQEFTQINGVWTQVRTLEVDENGELTAGHVWLTDDDWYWGATYSANNGTDPLAFNETQVVTVTNRYKHGIGNIAIYKELAGYYWDWGVDADTVFYATVADIADPRYPNILWFKSEPEADGTYRCVGNDVFGLSEPYSGTVMTEVPFSENNSIVLSNLWAEDSFYEVREVLSPGEYDVNVAYSFNDFVVPINDTQVVTIKNTFLSGFLPGDGDAGTGNLIVRKELNAAGYHADFDVDRNTVFHVKVWDVAHNNYLIFDPVPQPNGSLRCIGHLACDDDSCTNTVVGGVHYSETPGADYITEIPFSVNKSAVLSNLWTLGHEYRVEEIVDAAYSANCAVTYSSPGGTVGNNEILTITVTNTFKHGAGDLVINKLLTGNPADWDITGSTVFQAKIWDITAGNYLIFRSDPEPDGSYRCIGNTVNWLSEGYSGTPVSEVPFSADSSVVLSNLWPGREYRVEEIGDGNSTVSYSISTGLLNNAGVLSVTVTNAYPEKEVPPTSNDDDSGNGDNGGGNNRGGNNNGGDNDNGGGDTTGGNNGGGNNTGGGSNTSGGGSSGNDVTVTYNPPYDTEQQSPIIRSREIPPVISNPGHSIVMDDDGNFIQFDELGTPLGIWRWDDMAAEWIYDEYPPLGEIPQTGGDNSIIFSLLVSGLFLLGTGIQLRPKRKRAKGK